MKKLPKKQNALLLRTSFEDDAAWEDLCAAAQASNEDDFQASLDCVSDRAYEGLTIEQLLKAAEGSDLEFLFLADKIALSDDEKPIVVVDLYKKPGRTFRVISKEMWCVENNLSIANMSFSEFFDSADDDGIFRGFG